MSCRLIPYWEDQFHLRFLRFCFQKVFQFLPWINIKTFFSKHLIIHLMWTLDLISKLMSASKSPIFLFFAFHLCTLKMAVLMWLTVEFHIQKIEGKKKFDRRTSRRNSRQGERNTRWEPVPVFQRCAVVWFPPTACCNTPPPSVSGSVQKKAHN